MTDDNATKAPESDVQEVQLEPSAISSEDTRAQSGMILFTPFRDPVLKELGPSMGEHCVTSAPLSLNTPPKGEITYLSNIPTYISKPPSYPSEPSRLLLLLTGGTGLHSPNNQHQADLFAARGFVVVMPDQFDDDPAPNTGAVSPTAAQGIENEPSLLERVKLGAAETAKSFRIDMWLARQTPEKVLPVLGKVLEAAKETFADAVANGGGVYGVGYCVGAKYLLSLLAPPQSQGSGEGDEEKAATSQDPELKVGVIAHGAMITKDDLESVRRPLAVVAVEGDNLFPDDVREQGKAALELNGIEHDIRTFEGVPHGFAVVGDYGEEAIKEKQAEAFELMASWLEAH